MVESKASETKRGIPEASAGESQANKNKEQETEIDEEFMCAICWQLMYQPVTTQCGHTFCRSCLSDALKMKRECIICRKVVTQSAHSVFPVNIMVQNIIEKKYPQEVEKQKK